MFASSPVIEHFKLIKRAVALPLEDLKAGRGSSLHVDSIREKSVTVNQDTIAVRRVFIDMSKSDRFLEVGWVLNENVPCCLTCHKNFGTFTRRHHCRGCGTLICKACSYYGLMEGFKSLGKQIVCQKCFGATLADVKLNNHLNWGEAVYHAPTKVYVPGSIPNEAITPPPFHLSDHHHKSPVEDTAAEESKEGVEAERVLPVKEKVTTTTLEVVPVPGFVIRTAKLTESDKPVYINVFQHADIKDPEMRLTYSPAERNSLESPTITSASGTTTVETHTQAQAQAPVHALFHAQSADYEKVTPLVFSTAPGVVMEKGQECVLYNVLVSSAYFMVDPASLSAMASEQRVDVTHPTSVSKIIQVVNQTHSTDLSDRTFSLPNPLNGYTGPEITDAQVFVSVHWAVNHIPEGEISVVDQQARYGSVSSEVSGLSDSYSARSAPELEGAAKKSFSSRNSISRTASGPVRALRRGSSLIIGERRSSFRSGVAMVSPEHMVLNLSGTGITLKEDAELKKQAVTVPRAILGYQIIFPFENRADHTLTEADQANVYIITDVRKDASFHTEYKLSQAGADKSQWERLKRAEGKTGTEFRITANALNL